ncbi:PAS domain S-box protein [Halobacteria archaeon AArc-m2/3/4]|uniref:histidine kinase n=1 Tax=Natronoglomus mannanivorans TaxID=2979990 RepID=A0ABT2QA32_9EURY|nr:PAS domain S-box protein [Halobacteria archaeon AArc-m2/3/4]
MNRPRVLCVSSDRSTRATVTLSLADASVNVVVAQTSAIAVDRLEYESIDAVIIDASTVANVPGLLDAVESRWPGTPAFVHWSDDEQSSVTVLTEVIARAERIETATTPDAEVDSSTTSRRKTSSELAAAVTRRIGTRTDPAFDRLVGTVKRRLADARSPGSIEQAIREEFVADDRFAFAWVGEYDPGEREIVPWLTDAATVEWPMHRTFSIGDGSQPLLERTLRSRELQTVQQLADNQSIVPLGGAAADRQVESVATAPLATGDDLYGVLVVYTHEQLSTAGREAIRSIAETASYALESVAVRGQLGQQQQALRRYERLVETAGDGMYVLDGDGHFTTINDALLEMTGYSREGLLGEHISVLFDGDGVDATMETIDALLETDRSTDTVESVLETKSGGTIPCETQLAVLAHDDEFRGSVGVVRDITDRKRRERTLRQQNERLDAFARIVSHDLRNPLGVSKGYLDLLEETGSFDYLTNVREGLNRMEAIIADVLAIAREGEWAADSEPVDLEEISREAWENVATDDATISIEGSMLLDADRSRMLRLLENLFRNAVEHGTEPPRGRSAKGEEEGDGDPNAHPDERDTEPGSSLTVRVGVLEGDDSDATEREQGQSAQTTQAKHSETSEPERVESRPVGFFVEDNGRGMPAEIRDYAFDSEVTTSSSGLGIGLWVVREVATGHGWTTEATESETGGARFEFVVAETDD